MPEIDFRLQPFASRREAEQDSQIQYLRAQIHERDREIAYWRAQAALPADSPAQDRTLELWYVPDLTTDLRGPQVWTTIVVLDGVAICAPILRDQPPPEAGGLAALGMRVEGFRFRVRAIGPIDGADPVPPPPEGDSPDE